MQTNEANLGGEAALARRPGTILIYYFIGLITISIGVDKHNLSSRQAERKPHRGAD